MTGQQPATGGPAGPIHDSTAVAAYLLGTLSPAEAAEVERHLAGCERCQAEVADLAGLPDLLAQVDLDDLEPAPVAGDDLFSRVTAAVDADRERARRSRRGRRMVVSAAAAAVVAGGTAAGVLLTAGGGGPQTLVARSGPMTMTVQLAAETSGTGLDITVRGLPDDVHCRLVAVARSGARQVAGSWTATYAGTARVSGLTTTFSPSQLSRLVLQVSGTHQRLVARV